MKNWSSQIYFYGLSRPQNTEEFTLELSITTNIRKLGGNKKKQFDNITESEILKSNENFLILGDPGAGKTTTLKRITQKIFQSNDSILEGKFPILIRLKDLEIGDSLFRKICNIIGVAYETVKKESTIDYLNDLTNERLQKKILKNEYFINGIEIDKVIVQLFNSMGIILLLDGIDEIKNEIKNNILAEIQKISESQSSNSKIIVTCRTGDYHKTIIGFSICEICPLTNVQIKEIAKYWLKDYDAFFKELQDKPYKDLTDRPLFLGHLLLLFNKNAELPRKPIDVYARIIHQLMKDWDYDRDIVRKSKYSEFDTYRKIQFLEELSYILTYKIKTKVFNFNILSEAYRQIYKKYNLPINEIEIVVREIESHNGLIVKSFNDNYEFCHLSLQEYLCASYLVTLQLNSKNIQNYLYEYPAPLAIAVALSRNPANWLGNLILKSVTNYPIGHDLENKLVIPLRILLSRVLFENASFDSDSKEFGFSLLFLKLYFPNNLGKSLESLLSKSSAKLSLAEAIKFYKPISHRNNDFIQIKLINTNSSNDINVKIPPEGKLSKAFLTKMYKEFPNHLYNFKETLM